MQPHRPTLLLSEFSARGLHVFADWSGCKVSVPALRDAMHLRSLGLAFKRMCGLNAVGDAFHQFEPYGVTGTALLAESHLAIHTWPEIGFVTLDVYVCNYQTDNSDKAVALYSALKEHFQPRDGQFLQVTRSSRQRRHDGVPVSPTDATCAALNPPNRLSI